MLSDDADVPVPVPREKEFGLRSPRQLQDPKLPSKKEVEDHNLAGHMPYRNWCTFCVMGRGKATPHKKLPREDSLSRAKPRLLFHGNERRTESHYSRCQRNYIKDGLGDDGPHEGGID